MGAVVYFGYVQAQAESRRAVERARERQLQDKERREAEAARRAAQAPRPAPAPGAPQDAPPPLIISPQPTADRHTRHIIARVSRADGSIGVSAGDHCDFDVKVEKSTTRPAGYWCRAFVECNGVRLYGTDTPRRNGFFPCELFRHPMGVAGEDRETTHGTGDPFFQIDTRKDRMVVIDDATSMAGDAFHVEATIRSVR